MRTIPSLHLAFLKAFLARPLKVASPVPSGRKLAAKIAREIDPKPGGLVLELGPGTGAVTRAIGARGIADEDLVLIESDRAFVRALRKTFPRARVIEGDAFDFPALLGNDACGLRTVISGLPVVSEPPVRKRALVEAAIDALAPGRPLVQFSYSARPPLPVIEGVEVCRIATVWENIWPMRIWVYRRTPAPSV